MGAAAKKLVCDGREQYEVKALLTPTELKFYLALRESLEVYHQHLWIVTKIRIADVLKPGVSKKADNSLWYSLFGRIKSRHFDFAICDKSTSKVLCVIELNDSSHNRKKVKERDQFVRKACDTAGLKIYMFKPADYYSQDSIKIIFDHISSMI